MKSGLETASITEKGDYMSERKPNWAELLADCNLDAVFTALIEAVKADIKDINALPFEKRKYVKYSCNEYGDTAHIVRTDEHGFRIVEGDDPNFINRIILVKNTNNHHIRVHLNSDDANQPSLDYELIWDAKKQMCGLRVPGTTEDLLEVWQVSQAILSTFFTQRRVSSEGE